MESAAIKTSESASRVIKLIAPFFVFLGIFGFFGGFFRIFAACDCFFNYRNWIFVAMAIVFLFGLFFMAYHMKNNKKEYRFIHTVLAMVLFLVIYYTIMVLGEYFYVPAPFGITFSAGSCLLTIGECLL